MAAIFQIRRGTSDISSSITDGELYLHKGKGSLQFGSGSGNPITLLPLNVPVVGDINLSGSISASGDVRIGGNIYLGDNLANDSVNVNSPFSGSLIPSGSNIFDLGSNTYKYKNVYATSISGAIAATNGVISGSSQILGGTGIVSGSSQITYANISSIPSGIFSGSSQVDADSITNFDSNVKDKLNTDGVISGSSQVTLLLPNGVVSGSSQIPTLLPTGVVSGSSQVLGGTTIHSGSFFNGISVVSGSSQVIDILTELNSYSASLKSAIALSGTNVTINGNLTVVGTTTQIDSTTINIGDNIIELNYGGSQTTSGIIVKDATGGSTISGSLLWDSTNDYWKGGTLSNESKLLRADGDSVVSGSSQIIPLLPTGVVSGSSQITYTSISSIPAGIVSGSTQVTSLLPTGVVSGSSQVLGGTGIFSGSSQVDADSITNFDSNVKVKLDTDGVVSGSSQIIYTSISSIPAGIVSGSSQVVGILNSLNTYTGSNDTTNTTQNTRLSRLEESTSSLNTFSASMNAFYNQFTASGVGFSASVDSRLDELEYTASFGSEATIAGQFGALQTITASLMLATSSLQSFTSSQEEKNITIGSYTSSMNIFTASVNSHISNLNAATSSYETNGRGIVSGSSQITPLLPTGVISGSSQITSILPSGIVSGSAQVSGSIFTTISGDIAITTNGVATIQANSVALGVDTTGNYMSDLTQGTGVTISHTPGEGSTATISIAQAVATTSDVQFGSLGIGGAASGVSGEIRATGDITAFYSSDIRLKENIVPIENALSKVEAITGNTYNWKDGFEEIHSHKGNDLGIIAQEIQSVLPEVVTERDNGYLAVDYIKLIPVLIEAIKELSAKIKDLENK
jgi:hypothetical protein